MGSVLALLSSNTLSIVLSYGFQSSSEKPAVHLNVAPAKVIFFSMGCLAVFTVFAFLWFYQHAGFLCIHLTCVCDRISNLLFDVLHPFFRIPPTIS